MTWRPAPPQLLQAEVKSQAGVPAGTGSMQWTPPVDTRILSMSLSATALYQGQADFYVNTVYICSSFAAWADSADGAPISVSGGETLTVKLSGFRIVDGSGTFPTTVVYLRLEIEQDIPE